jgi:hypothetical protein
MWSHLTPIVFAVPIALRVIWKAPDWGFKVVMLAEAIRRYRRRKGRDTQSEQLDIAIHTLTITHPCADPDRAESDVLDLLTGAGRLRLWSLEEIGWEIGSQVTAHDALAGLHRAGLIHRTADGFVFASRAAMRASKLAR